MILCKQAHWSYHIKANKNIIRWEERMQIKLVDWCTPDKLLIHQYLIFYFSSVFCYDGHYWFQITHIWSSSRTLHCYDYVWAIPLGPTCIMADGTPYKWFVQRHMYKAFLVVKKMSYRLISVYILADFKRTQYVSTHRPTYTDSYSPTQQTHAQTST